MGTCARHDTRSAKLFPDLVGGVLHGVARLLGGIASLVSDVGRSIFRLVGEVLGGIAHIIGHVRGGIHRLVLGIRLENTGFLQSWNDLIGHLGGSVDASETDFASSTEIGLLTEDRTVDGSGIILGGDEFQTGLKASTLAWAAHVATAFVFSERLEATISGRYVRVDVELDDQLGTDLDGALDLLERLLE